MDSPSKILLYEDIIHVLLPDQDKGKWPSFHLQGQESTNKGWESLTETFVIDLLYTFPDK